MRIALATPEYITESTFDGGLANYTHRIALALRAMGHEPVIFLPYDSNATFIHEDIVIHRVQTWNPAKQWKLLYSYVRIIDRLTLKCFHMSINLFWRSLRINQAIRREHRKCPFDIVQYAHLGGLGMLRSRAISAVTRLSSSTRLCQELGGYGESGFQILQQQWIERIAMKRADIVFGPSERIAKMTEEECGVHVRIIESPFLPDITSVDDTVYRSHLAGKEYLLFFGSIGLIKGVGTIAEIIHSLLERHPGLSFAFVGKRLPGQDGGDLMERVWANAGEFRDRVLWLPSQSHEALYPIIAHAKAVVLPSRIDNFPNACIEAMALERVVVGTKGNGFEQLIHDGESGFLCSVDDPQGLLATIERVLTLSPAELRTIGGRAEERIRALHPENTVSALLDCYLDAMDMHSKKIVSPRIACVASAG